MRDHFRYPWGSLAVLVLAALPGCSLDESGTNSDSRGAFPHGSAIRCDIEDFRMPQRQCLDPSASPSPSPIRLADAAPALAQNRSSLIALDDSSAALARCNGQPEQIFFTCPYPDGCPICLNCGVIGQRYANADAACVNFCIEKNVELAGTFSAPSILFFCLNPDKGNPARHGGQASPKTDGCFDKACTPAGAPFPSFPDPRRRPIRVSWTNVTNLSVNQSTLSHSAPSGTNFDGGASSNETIRGGDGYVEFRINTGNGERMLGLSQGAGASDNDPFADGIGYGFHLTAQNQIFISEYGVSYGPFGTAAPGDRLRVKATQRPNGTAAISYTQATTKSCTTMNEGCEGTILRQATNGVSYPLHVDVSIRDQGAGFDNVSLVGILK